MKPLTKPGAKGSKLRQPQAVPPLLPAIAKGKTALKAVSEPELASRSAVWSLLARPPIPLLRRRLPSPAEDAEDTERLDDEFMRRELKSQERQLYARLEEMKMLLQDWFRFEGGDVKTNLGFKLKDLDQTVQKLATIARKRPPGVLWDCYIAVNRRFRKLHLIKEIERLVARATKNVPQRPIANLIRLNGAVPEDLLKIWRKWKKGQKDGTRTNWRDFEPLFKKWRISSKTSLSKIGNESVDAREAGSPTLIAFNSFLEIANDDSEWIKRFWNEVWALREWIETDLCSRSLADIGEPLFNDSADPGYGDRLSKLDAENRRDWARKKARIRKARQRRKSSGQKA